MEEKENLVSENVEKVEEVQPVEESKYPHEGLQKVEDERKVFWKSYKLHNTIKTIVLFICMAAIITSFFVFPNVIPKEKSGLQLGLTITVAVVCLGGAYGYSVYVRRKFEGRMKEYFDLYFRSVNDYVFEDKVFSDVELQVPGKIILDEFNECKLYKDVFQAGSRGLTTFKCKGIESSIVDCAGSVKAEKRVKPVFVGKMVRTKASYEGEEPVYIYLKGNERSLPPTNLEEVKNVLEDQKKVVYSNYKDWKKVVNSSVIKALDAMHTDKILVDLAVSIYSGKAYIMMGYDDPLMVLPLQTKFDSKPTEIYKKDMEALAKLIEALNK